MALICERTCKFNNAVYDTERKDKWANVVTNCFLESTVACDCIFDWTFNVSLCQSYLLQQKIVSKNNPLNVTLKSCSCLSQLSALTSPLMYLIATFKDLFLPCKGNLDLHSNDFYVKAQLVKDSVFALCGEHNDLSYLGI